MLARISQWLEAAEGHIALSDNVGEHNFRPHHAVAEFEAVSKEAEQEAPRDDLLVDTTARTEPCLTQCLQRGQPSVVHIGVADSSLENLLATSVDAKLVRPKALVKHVDDLREAMNQCFVQPEKGRETDVHTPNSVAKYRNMAKQGMRGRRSKVNVH